MYRGSKIVFVPDVFQSFFRFLFRISIFFRRGTLQETHIRRQFQLAALTFSDTILIFIHDIGDLIGGRDYITGISIKKALKSKIITYENGIKSVQYNLEE